MPVDLDGSPSASFEATRYSAFGSQPSAIARRATPASGSNAVSSRSSAPACAATACIAPWRTPPITVPSSLSASTPDGL